MKVLVADDEKELVNALCAILKKNNYTVDSVYNGQDALDYILFGNYDAVILDIMMPELDGYQVLEKVREKGIKTPVLILTAKGEIDFRVKGLDLGADDYLPKPFEIKELLARLRAIIRRNNTNASNKLIFHGLTLDLASYTLSANGKSIKLANKEFQIMELFMSRPEKLISTESIVSKVWDYDTDVELNVVWVFISGLRKKIAGLDKNIVLKSNRGIGYSLEIISDD